MTLDTLAFDNEHKEFAESFARFLAKSVVPKYPEWRASGAIPKSVYQAAGELGFLGIYASEEYGGSGVTDPLFGAVLIREAMAAGCTGFAVTLAWHSLVCIPFLSTHASPAQKAQWLPALAAGEKLVMPLDGSPLETVGGSDGDAVVKGQVGSVVGGSVANLFVTVVTTGSETSVVMAECNSDAGASAASVEPVTGMLGLQEAAVADVDFGGGTGRCDVIAGTSGSDIATAVDLWLAMVHLAGAHAAFDNTVVYVQERKVFGKPLSTFENTQFRLGQLSGRYAGVRAEVLTVIGANSTVPQSNSYAASVRRLAADLHQEAVDLGLQLHGGYGYMREYPIAQAFADAGFLFALGGFGSDVYQDVAPLSGF